MIRILILSVVFSVHAWAVAPIALVYDGRGACPEDCASSAAAMARSAGFDVRFVNANWWKASDFAEAAVYVQPGGHSSEVAKALSHSQKEMIRRFVRDGGGFVGFCAGAFFASARTQQKSGAFFSDERLGLIPMTTQWLDVPTEAAILPVQWNGSARDVYWEGGPYFHGPVAPGVEVAAFYPDQSIAAVRTTYGSGRVYVTGFHPEAPQWWRDDFKLNDRDGLDWQQAAEMFTWVNAHPLVSRP